MTEKTSLYIQAALGDQASKFFESDIGQYVIERSMIAIADNQKKFEAASVDEIDRVAKEVHYNIRVVREALKWLNDAINDGLNALQQLDAEERQAYM